MAWSSGKSIAQILASAPSAPASNPVIVRFARKTAPPEPTREEIEEKARVAAEKAEAVAEKQRKRLAIAREKSDRNARIAEFRVEFVWRTPASFHRRYGAVGEVLADAVPVLSLDLVALIVRYLMFAAASHLSTSRLTYSLSVCTYTTRGVKLQEKQDVHTTSPVRGIAFDNNGEGYVTEAKYNRVLVLNRSREKLRSLFRDSENFDKPDGVAVDGKLSRDGQTLAVHNCKSNKFAAISALAVNHEQNELWAVVRDRSCIQVFDMELKFLRQIGGGKSKAEGMFNHPLSVAFDHAGNAVVADEKNNRVQVLCADGKFITMIGRGETRKPTCVCVDGEGRYLVGLFERGMRVFAFE